MPKMKVKLKHTIVSRAPVANTDHKKNDLDSDDDSDRVHAIILSKSKAPKAAIDRKISSPLMRGETSGRRVSKKIVTEVTGSFTTIAAEKRVEGNVLSDDDLNVSHRVKRMKGSQVFSRHNKRMKVQSDDPKSPMISADEKGVEEKISEDEDSDVSIIVKRRIRVSLPMAVTAKGGESTVRKPLNDSQIQAGLDKLATRFKLGKSDYLALCRARGKRPTRNQLNIRAFPRAILFEPDNENPEIPSSPPEDKNIIKGPQHAFDLLTRDMTPERVDEFRKRSEGASNKKKIEKKERNRKEKEEKEKKRQDEKGGEKGEEREQEWDWRGGRGGNSSGRRESSRGSWRRDMNSKGT
ncbi:hypothetical protein L873DRAFT_1845145 [Choiromyces venosus 120613-1]|uniref:Uncharacterized protein n=1 Tax=Choiromyces venosus 120613-1 TaxID=1336337 RepID=A0A3N4JF59_9PEZI|nr:hypothetical protein L873DRAFT_1845145 [Choiromyces venosus 120613-1]